MTKVPSVNHCRSLSLSRDSSNVRKVKYGDSRIASPPAAARTPATRSDLDSGAIGSDARAPDAAAPEVAGRGAVDGTGPASETAVEGGFGLRATRARPRRPSTGPAS